MEPLIFVDIIYALCKKHNLKVGYMYENDYQFSFSVSRSDKQGYNVIIEKNVWKRDYKSEGQFTNEFEENFKEIIK